VSLEHVSPVGPATLPHESEQPAFVGNRPPRRPLRRVWQVLLALVVLAICAVAGAAFYLDQRFAGKIYPNIAIRGVQVGELTTVEARRLLEKQYASFLAQPVTITYGDRSWTPTMSELGVRLDIDQAVLAAMEAGRGAGFIDNARQTLAVWQEGLEIPLRVTINQAQMQEYLLARTGEIDRPAADAQLIFEGTLLASQPSSAGYQVLVNETLQEITAAVQSLSPQTVAMRTRELAPSLDNSAVQAAQERIAALVRSPILLNGELPGQEYSWSPAELAELVRVERVAGTTGDQLAITIDREQLAQRITAIADDTEQRGAYPRVDWNGGNLQIIKPGTEGRRVDEVAALELVLAAFERPATDRVVELPFRAVPPPVTEANLAQLGINELLSVGRSDFSGSAPYRITNIGAGMRLLHGILLAPGDEFSFNKNIGSIDEANGFVEGYAIIQNRTQLEWGGGICQDSTTMFRAAFWAGLPITERWGHSFYISWYDKYAFGEYGNGPGMDATIFTGGPDLKFVNDTGNWLLIQTFVDNRQTLAEVRMYGTNDGREVSMPGPAKITDRVPAPTEPVYVGDPERPRGTIRQSDTARGGMTISFTRIVKRNGQVIEQRDFQTKFRPWPNIFELNPADIGPDGKPIRREPTPPPAPTADPNQPPAQPAPAEPQPVPAEPQPAPPAEPQPTPVP
jgi:vancomycin resistance protein YoaR